MDTFLEGLSALSKSKRTLRDFAEKHGIEIYGIPELDYRLVSKWLLDQSEGNVNCGSERPDK